MGSRACLLALVALSACGDDTPPEYSVLVYTRENLWMHPSNPVASGALLELGRQRGWEIETAATPDVFTPERLSSTDVVVFSVTSGDVLDDPARAALQDFFAAGGGFVGTHSASATELSWPYYHASVVPVLFKTHPQIVNVLPGVLTRESDSPLLEGVPDRWADTDEFYTFVERPEELGLDLLLALDESTMGPDYTDDCRVGYHPVAFTHERSGGRAFYTALGHTPESYSDPIFMGMLERAIVWAAEPRFAERVGLE